MAHQHPESKKTSLVLFRGIHYSADRKLYMTIERGNTDKNHQFKDEKRESNPPGEMSKYNDVWLPYTHV